MTTNPPQHAADFDLLYCSGGNERLMKIALEAGYLLGIRSDRPWYGLPISFVDVEYRNPDFTAHLEVVKKLRPKYATVPDLSETEVSEQDIARAVTQAEILSNYCAIPLIVPKISGQLAFIPSKYAIAYSVPTSYGGAKYGVWKLVGRRVHLLGGSPHMQMKLYHYLGKAIQSVDGNMSQLMATKFAKYWQAHKWVDHPLRGQKQPDIYLDCWQRSCVNIKQAWQGGAAGMARWCCMNAQPVRKEDFDIIYNPDGTCGYHWNCSEPGTVLAYDVFSPESATWFCADCWEEANEGMPAEWLSIVEDRR